MLLVIKEMTGYTKIQCGSCQYVFDPSKEVGLATPSPRAPHGGICCPKCYTLVSHNRPYVDVLGPPYVEGA